MSIIYETDVNVEKGESQYKDYDLEKVKIVEASYIHSLLKTDSGNIYIEALPPPRIKENIWNEYYRPLVTYDESKIAGMSRYERFVNIKTIRNLRIPLPFCYDLEVEFNSALLTSYAARQLIRDENTDLECSVSGRKVFQHSILVGDPAASSTGFFSLLGISGTGKSSMIKVLLSRYPQVIVHNLGVNYKEVQVVYLVVNCSANSNFSALYASIGHALDLALQNIDGTFEKEIERQKSIGKKSACIERLIEVFKIGAIILDEVQELNFDKTRESSFDSLLTLVNDTKVALITVGTEEAYEKMYSSLRMCRRGGRNILAHGYCNFRKNKDNVDKNDVNERYFRGMLTSIFKYQWFENRVKLTEDILNAFYEVTKGIIDQIITIYIYMHIDYYNDAYAGCRPVINGDYVRKVANKYCPKVRKYIDELDYYMQSEGIFACKEVRAEAEAELNRMILKTQKEDSAKVLVDQAENLSDSMITLNRVVKELTCSAVFDYTEEEIGTAFTKVVSAGHKKYKDFKVFLRLVIDQIERTRKKNNAVQKNQGSGGKGISSTHKLGLNFLGLKEENGDVV